MTDAAKAERLKAEGNSAFQSGNYATAISLYSSAIDADPSNRYYYLNRSQANLKLGRWSQAEHDASKALELQPDDHKALYRRAVARRELGNLDGAREDIKTFLQVGGEPTVVERELAKIPGYKITNAGDKGLGVFALQAFRRGDLIVAEAPLFEIRKQDDGGPIDHQSVAAAIDRLSSEEVQKYVSLKNAHAEGGCYDNPFLGIYATFQMDSDHSGIFLEVSRFNHSCSPNARHSWNPDIKRMRVYALCDIACGDEIFVSYISSRNVYGSSRAERRTRLSRYKFTCACTACGLQGPAAVASDERRLQIKALWESVPYFPPQKSRNRLLAIVQAIHLLEGEGYAADYDDFTNDAAAICAYHSDWVSAKYWAVKTYETRVAEFGEDSYRAKEVKDMMLDPKTGSLAGMGPKQKFTSVRL